MYKNLLITDNGRIAQTILTGDNSKITEDEFYHGFRVRFIETSVEDIELMNGYYYDLEAEELVSLPAKPSEGYIWDGVTKSWVVDEENLVLINKRLKLTVDRIRENKEISTIPYDDKNLDADAEAIKNINGKLQELQAKEALSLPIDVNSLFWRDADNIIHSWEDVAAYKTWLQGLIIAIAERTSNLYQISWTKKAEIDAILENETLPNEEKLQNLLSYDINAGWDI